MATLLATGGMYAIGSYDWCGRWPSAEPQLLGVGTAEGALFAGAAKVELQPPYPVVVAGYSPPRPEVKEARAPLYARAVVFRVEAVKVALVSVDLLTLPAPLAEEIRGRAAGLGLGELWVSATHAHSSFGGYDARTVSELAGTGRYRDGSRAAVVEAAVKALGEADASLRPASLGLGEGRPTELTSPRSGEVVDQRLTRLSVRGEGGPIAELVVFAAHPTLVSGKTGALDADWPGALAGREDAKAGVTLVLQGAVGNVSVADPTGGPEAFAGKLFEVLQAVALEAQAGPVRLGYCRVSVALPRPDSSRVPGVPALLRAAGDNFLCSSAPRHAEVSGLVLGPLSLLGVPVEPTLASARTLEAAAGTHRSVALANGYLGYLEPVAVVAAGGGESKRQYFAAGLETELARAAKLAGQGLGLAPRAP
ncbi:MAG: neutral/alkaline non-lysosomal ceramidase N-terminal domain-containing protein [Myxococcaceae bacterium]